MVIVSPYARAAYTDHTTASLSSLHPRLHRRHVFRLAPLGADATAYPYTNAFNYHRTPLTPVPLLQHRLPRAALAFLRTPAQPRPTPPKPPRRPGGNGSPRDRLRSGPRCAQPAPALATQTCNREFAAGILRAG